MLSAGQPAARADLHTNTADGPAAYVLEFRFHVAAAQIRTEQLLPWDPRMPFPSQDRAAGTRLEAASAATARRFRHVLRADKFAGCDQCGQADARSVFPVQKQ